MARQQHCGRGFTLVELLVVIGIIALLISILLPSLSRARESANSLKCLNNLRSLGTAFTMYNNENNGRFPAPAVTARVDDWIYWQAARFADRDEGRIVPYLGGKMNDNMFRCPSDPIEGRKQEAADPYNYSYTVNENIFQNSARDAKQPTLVVTQIINPSQKILAIDESYETVDDGCWAPQRYSIDQRNVLSRKHEKTNEDQSDPNNGRGNVVFADGHAKFFRRDAFLKQHYDPKSR